jgi:hypothetical protein
MIYWFHSGFKLAFIFIFISFILPHHYFLFCSLSILSSILPFPPFRLDFAFLPLSFSIFHFVFSLFYFSELTLASFHLFLFYFIYFILLFLLSFYSIHSALWFLDFILYLLVSLPSFLFSFSLPPYLPISPFSISISLILYLLYHSLFPYLYLPYLPIPLSFYLPISAPWNIRFLYFISLLPGCIFQCTCSSGHTG